MSQSSRSPDSPERLRAPPETSTLPLSRIVVAVDGSPQALHACRWAADLARCSDAALTALHVVVPTWPPSSLPHPRTAERAEQAARLRGERLLEEARTLAGYGAPFTGELVFGDPGEAICTRADELAADLVVVGSRGLGALDRVLLGSVSGGVSRRAPCPVLVVRGRATGVGAPGAPRV